MHKFFCAKHFFIAAVCVAFVVLAVPCVQASGVEIIPWIGKVVDKETGEPVEGAVIVRSWNRYALGPAGPARLSETVEEVLTNKKGKFVFCKKKFQVSVPGYWVEEENPLVYRPGYKALFLDDKPTTIKLQRVPTLAATREHEIDLRYKGIDIDAAKILSEMLINEEDFIERNLKHREVGFSIKRKDDPSYSRDKVGGRFYTRFNFSEDMGAGQGFYSFDSLGLKNSVSQGPKAFLAELQKKDCGTQAAACYALRNKKDQQSLRLLMAVLKKSSCEEAKRRATNILIKNAGGFGAEDLMELAQDKDCRLRAAACVALGKKKDARAARIFMETLQHDSCGDVKKNAAEGLVKLGPLADKALEEALAGRDEALKKELVWVVGQRPVEKNTRNPFSGLDHPLEESLLADLRSSPPEVRIQKLQRLGRWNNALAVKPIMEILITETDSKVKKAATDALLNMGAPAIVELAYAAGSGRDQNSAECMQILDKLLDRKEIERVIERLDPSEKSNWGSKAYVKGNEDVIAHLKVGIPQDRDNRVLKHFKTMLLDRHAGPKDLAALRLGQLGGEGYDVLEEALRSDYSETRTCAARAMGIFKNKRFVKPLIVALEDNHPEVQRMAVWALGELNDPRAIDPLVAALNSDAKVRKKVREVLVTMSIEDTTSLREFLKGNTHTGKQEAVWVLGELQDNKSAKQIKGLLATSTDPDVRAQAELFFGKIKGQRSLPDLIQAFRDNGNTKNARNTASSIVSIINNTEELVSTAQRQQVLSLFIESAKNSSSHYQRPTAIYALGELQDTQGTDVLLHILKSESPLASARTSESIAVRRILSGAAKALGEIKDPASVEPLIVLLKDKESGQYAAAALGHIKDPRAVEPLIALLDDPHSGGAAVHALRDIGDVRAVESLVEILDNENHANRYRAAFALGSFNDSRAKEALVRACRSEDVRMMRTAKSSLEKIDKQHATELLAEMLTQEVDPAVRANALEIIFARNDPVFIDALIDALEKDETALVREKAARVLGRLKDTRAIDPLVAVLEVEEDEQVRKACLNALDRITPGTRSKERYWPPTESLQADLKSDIPRKRVQAVDGLRWKEDDPGAVEALLQATQDDDGKVRSRAFEALGRRKDQAAIKPLLAMLENECDVYRSPAWKTLKTMGSMAVEDMILLLKHKSACMRRRSAAYLGGTRDARALKYLEKSLDDKDPEVRSAAAGALYSIWIGKEVAADWAIANKDIIPMLGHRSVRVRRSAARALGIGGDARAVDALIGCLQDKEAEVRWSAAWSLGQIGDSRAIDGLTLLAEESDIGIRRRAQTSVREIRFVEKKRETLAARTLDTF